MAEFAGTVQTRRENDAVVELQKQQVVDKHAALEKERNATVRPAGYHAIVTTPQFIISTAVV